MKKITLAAPLLFASVCSVVAPPLHAAPQSCEQLAQLNLPNAKVTSAQPIAAGAFTPPQGATPWLVGDPSFYKQVPAFCRVLIQDQPSADSDIKIEVWLPASGWNGKFRGQGNGGFAGEIDYHSLALAVLQGYATAATDTGHAASGVDATWALNHPEKITDFAYRAIHEMTTLAKSTTQAFYGDAAKHNYFSNCSNGGRQALMEVQRYPEDYDGVIAGAPANYWTHLLTGALWDAQATTLDRASYIPSSKIPAIAQAVNAACDTQDGDTDKIVTDPRICHFKPSTMLCKSGDSDSCLTSKQVEALDKLYSGAHDSKGQQIFPGFVPGGEEGGGGWSLWITGNEPGKALLFFFGGGYFANMVYSKADWDYKTAKLDDAVKASDDKFAGIFNATQTDLKPFEKRGGKLVIYHGWSDAAISPLNAINYYEAVSKKMGQQDVDSFVRLYMIPGMQHCGSGPGVDVFGQNGLATANDPQHSMYLALENWVEKNTPPPTIIGAQLDGPTPSSHVVMTRPLCAYPQVAKYKGTGDVNDAANFICAAPK